jgi:hypothetical protein
MLRGEQITALNERIDEFRNANYKGRKNIEREAFASFRETWPQDAEDIGQADMRTVNAPLLTLSRSHILLAYSAAPLQ